MPDRSREFWTPEPIWRGATCFLLGGGPSLTTDDVNRLRGRHVLAINSSAILAPWAEVLFFHDCEWFERHRELVAGWPGLVVTMSRAAKEALPDKLKRVRGELRPTFPPIGAATIKSGRSSGHSAVGLAAAFGAARIVLLGYDLRRIAGRSHHHDEYAHPDSTLYWRYWLPAWRGYREAAAAAGVEIINATPGSRLTCFRSASLSDILRWQ